MGITSVLMVEEMNVWHVGGDLNLSKRPARKDKKSGKDKA